MKVLLVRGNPRKSGCTQEIADILLHALQQNGAQVFDVNISEKNIKHCLGCFACKNSPQKKCVINDDMAQILDCLKQADLILCLTPVYFYSMSSQMKMFWDRCFPIVEGYKKSDNKFGWENRTSLENRKKFVAISVASGGFKNSFSPILQTWEIIANAMGFDLIANIVRDESLFLKHPNQKLELVKRVKDAFFNLGETLAKNLKIDEKIIADTQLNFSESEDVFLYNSELFWKKLTLKNNSKNSETPTLESVTQKTLNCINASSIKQDVSIEIYFEDFKKSANFLVQKGRLILSSNPQETPDLKISCTSIIWIDFLDKKIKIIEQLSRGNIKLKGNIHIFTHLKVHSTLTKAEPLT